MRFYLLFLSLLLSVHSIVAQNNPVDYVNPFIGTGGHGHTFPGACLPHGMLQLSPDTRLDGWDGCSGYHYSDSFIYGFSHTHLSGTGVSDYGDILLMPMAKNPSPKNSIYGSAFSHNREKAAAGYYSVFLEDDGIDVELTATTRTGFHSYSYPDREGSVILDLHHRDEVLESSLQIVDSITVTGMRRSKAWAQNQYVFFVMKFSKPFYQYGIWKHDSLISAEIKSMRNEKNIKAFFSFHLGKEKNLQIKLAISPVSVEGAFKNLQAENPGWNFEQTRNEATGAWNKELSVIEVEDSSETRKTIFYTALYHTAIAPNIQMDVDRRYRGMDNEIHTAENFDYYSVFSLWDTYRATHPLYTVIDEKRTLDYIQTFLAQYKQGGRLPVWELASNETDCMIGYHSVSLIADAYLKGIRGFDTKLALEAMQSSAQADRFGLKGYKEKGLIEASDDHESVSKTLEYAYDDWCIAQFAKALGEDAIYHRYMQRAQYYKNILHPQTGFMQPRDNGGWILPFAPEEVNNHYTEANSWQYSFYVPQDIDGYMKLLGGKKRLEQKLDALFAASEKTSGRNQADITGLIGQYAHGNEPSHHIIYLYNYVGKPHKTQHFLHKVMNEFYTNAADGLIGNEDCGQMSAWYIWSAMGFYPVTPGANQYDIGTALFKKVTLHLENGKKFIIEKKSNSPNAQFVRSLQLQKENKETIQNRYYLLHEDIAAGGRLEFEMGEKPGSGEQESYRMTSIQQQTPEDLIVLNPELHFNSQAFKGRQRIEISTHPFQKTTVYYTNDGSKPTRESKKYKKAFFIDSSTTLQVIAIDKKNKESKISTAQFYKINHDYSIRFLTEHSPQYTAGGPLGLIDGIRGSVDWRKGNWQGYQHTDFKAIVDLKTHTSLEGMSLRFLQDTRAWIVAPRRITVSLSEDGVHFIPADSIENILPIEDLNVQIKTVEIPLQNQTARYIKIEAAQYGHLPSWHEGAGGNTHIFIDEISVEPHTKNQKR